MAPPRIGFPWLTLSFHWGMADQERAEKLRYRTDRAATEAVEDDEQLWTRYRRSGIDAVMVTLTVVDRGAFLPRATHRPAPPALWGGMEYVTGLMIGGSRHDRPELDESEFDSWLATQVRELLESWKRLIPA